MQEAAGRAPWRPTAVAWLLARLALTGAVLAWLVHGLRAEGLAEVARGVSPGWIGLAFLLKAASLVLHEVRTWYPLPRPRPPLGGVVRLCLGVGMLNLVAPARAGDVAIVAALHRRYGVPVGSAAAVIGVTSLLEALVFGLVLVLALALSPGGPTGLLGVEAERPLLELAAAAALASLLAGGAAVAAGRLARRWTRPAGLLGVLHRTLVDTAALLSSPASLLRNTGLAALQVGCLVAAFAAGIPAAGLDGLPALAAASQVLAVSSLASVILPPTWGLGPAAASRLVLGAYGVGPEAALVYAGVYWAIAHLPFLLLGLPALWWDRAR